MKIAIIADVHDNLANLSKVLTFIKKEGINFLICCGDIGNQETIAYLAQNFTGQIYLAYGNVEEDVLSEIPTWPNLAISRFYGTVEPDKQRISFCHWSKIVQKLLSEENLPKLIFYGHTHIPNEKIEQGVRLINPGTVAGLFSRPTFALYNTEDDKVVLIEVSQI